MRKPHLMIASAVALTVASSAIAGVPGPQLFAESAALRGDPITVTCHFVTHEGSMVRQRRCATQAGWDRTRWETQQTITAMQVHSFSTPLGR